MGDAVSAGPGVVPTPTTAPVILPYSPDENLVRKLQKSAAVCRKKLEWTRKLRMRLLREYVGRHYGGLMDEQSRAQPLNFFARTIWTLIPQLVANEIEYTATTQNLQLRDFASIFGLAVTHLTKRVELSNTLRLLVLDAFFSMGIVKQGMTFGREVVSILGTLHDVGQPFADRVSFDDYYIDPQARSRETAWYEGDRYRMPLDYIRSSGLYQNFDRLRGWCDRREKPASSLGNGGATENEIEELVEQAMLLDLYIPQENLLVTIPVSEDQGTKPLRVVEWEGPRQGPYEALAFHLVPDNVLAVPETGIWYDLHQLINQEARRIVYEAGRRKTVLAYTPATADDAERIASAADGDTVAVSSIDQIKEVNFGGATEQGFATMNWFRSMFTYLTGNADLAGGLGGQNADTATEASIMQGNSQSVLGDLRTVTNQFSLRIVQKFAWYLWTDPLINLPLARRLPSGGEEQVTFSPDARQGDFLDYQFTITTNAIQTMDPAIRAKRMMELANMAISTAQLAAAKGDIPDAKQIIKDLGSAIGIPGVEQWFTSMQGVPAMNATTAVAGMIPPGRGGSPAAGAAGNPMNPDAPQYTGQPGLLAQANGKPGNELNNSGGY